MIASRIELSLSPADVLRRLDGDRMPFALVGRWAGGGAILGSEPVQVVSSVPEVSPIDAPEGFVGGGWVGYLGFGLGAAFERLPPAPPRPAPLPVTRFAFYDHVLRMDASGQWWFEALTRCRGSHRCWSGCGRPCRRVGRGGSRRFARAGRERRATAPRSPTAWSGSRRASSSRRTSACGWRGASKGARWRRSRQPPSGCSRRTGRTSTGLLSFSPELFLKRVGRDVETAPIKGTAPRVDASSTTRDELVASAKDAAEHVMIVDLMRNDLGRVAEYGSVTAPLVPDVEAHPGVWHLVSRVRGTARARASTTRRCSAPRSRPARSPAPRRSRP